jgi:hypothetical protein
MDERLSVVDVAGASLTLLGVLAERYVKSGYCDPTMFRALEGASELAEQFRLEVVDKYEHHQDQDLIEGVTELASNLRLMAMEAGELVNRIIEENGLPVKPNTFELDPDHPNFVEHGEDCDCQKDGE